MKKTILLLFLVNLCLVFSQNRYELNDENSDKYYLSDSITVMAKDSLITDKPIVAVDGVPFRYIDLQDKKLNIFKSDIKSIVFLEQEVGIALYGEYAKAGVLIITTFRRKEE